MKIYLIPGLGYTHRIYEKMSLNDFDVTYLNWIEPKRNETIQNYAKRLFKDLPKTNEKIVLIGHSFGGIISQVIAEYQSINTIILLSSIQSRIEMPLFFKMVKPFRFYHFFTKEISIKTVKYWGENHGFETEKERELFSEMVGSYSNNYLQWALKTLSNWQTPNISKTTKIVQIHGTNDKTFPIQFIKNADVIIEDGSHVMVYKQSEKIRDVIIQQLKQP
ncbi:MAG: alpha/beta hydrolase [Saprospiraceae bacterium]